MVLPIPPIGVGTGPLIENASPASTGASTGGASFGQMLESSINQISQAQTSAAQQTQAVATGQSSDLSSVVMAVQEANLEVSLASQVQTKAVDAYQSIFQTQV
jgi:flagellar hook-basal body complex protein FliE